MLVDEIYSSDRIIHKGYLKINGGSVVSAHVALVQIPGMMPYLALVCIRSLLCSKKFFFGYYGFSPY